MAFASNKGRSASFSSITEGEAEFWAQSILNPLLTFFVPSPPCPPAFPLLRSAEENDRGDGSDKQEKLWALMASYLASGA
jgi:hypothetical protein